VILGINGILTVVPTGSDKFKLGKSTLAHTLGSGVGTA
jgi:hypothetical protein